MSTVPGAPADPSEPVDGATGTERIDDHADDRDDRDDRDGPARLADPRTRTLGMIAPVDPPPTPEQADRTDG